MSSLYDRIQTNEIKMKDGGDLICEICCATAVVLPALLYCCHLLCTACWSVCAFSLLSISWCPLCAHAAVLLLWSVILRTFLKW